MCTVVVRWQAGQPLQILALRDESTARPFDDPDRWWPDTPDLVGGRDQTAGGTWCANNVATGVTAMVLNRAPKRVADPGAPSRGVLPLLAAQREAAWTEHLDVEGMASFALVLATPARLTTWEYDGTELTTTELDAGTHMVTSGGAEDGKAAHYLDRFAAAEFPAGWQALVEAETPRDDPASLVIRHEAETFVYATVFGQLIDAAPGRLRIDYSRTPWLSGSWRRRVE
ncbi:MAG: NRDE family protein [Frankiaceae bacterium]|nr:NRDE family protein [Frankiaceae bacterium]MBV9369613.1 NRDE family protein [Frankiales bacterium]